MSFIYKEEFGQGEPLVMLHGWAMHTGVWRNFAEKLASEYHVTCLDLPGHGRSEQIEPFTLELLVDELVVVLPKQACRVIGWSLGGMVALRLAEKYPEKIKSLSLIASNPHFVKTSTWSGVTSGELDAFTKNIKRNASAGLLRFMSIQVQGASDMKLCLRQAKNALAECALPREGVLIEGLQILRSDDLREALKNLKIPVQMIFGEQDSLVPMSVGGECQTLNPELELQIIEGAGHIPFVSHESNTLSLVRDFFAREGV